MYIGANELYQLPVAIIRRGFYDMVREKHKHV